MCLFTFWPRSETKAQTETPTPPNSPIFVTNTPAPAQNTGCNGQPQGWGTITPNAYWLDKCYACITRTPYYFFPTLTPAPWETPATPLPTNTGQPTITPTPNWGLFTISSYTGIDNWIQGTDYPLSLVNWSYSNRPVPWIKTDMNTSNEGGTTFKYTLRFVGNGNFANGTNEEGWKVVVRNPNDRVTSGVGSGSLSGFTFSRTGYGENSSWLWMSQNGGNYTYDGTLVITSKCNVTNCYQVQVDLWPASLTGGNNAYMHNYWWQGEINPYIPTPTPNPNANSICNTVNGGTTVDDSGNFGLPEIEIGWARCVQIGGWVIPLGWIENLIPNLNLGESFQIPGIQFCFKPIYFGSLTVFGLSIDLDFIAVVMAGALLFRIIFRS